MAPPSMDDIDAVLRDQLEEVEWTATKHVSAHEYLTVHEYPGFYYWMCAAIEREGYPVNAFSYDWVYYDLDGYHYWWTLECINRVPIGGGEEDWDPVADESYDHEPDQPEAVTRTTFVLEKFGPSGPNR